ncbi:ATP-binding cassette domain-containing protein [Epidermidibacterium keratini]|uniref:ATP-binding cassette domain-containing protein n=1 Tax=Epidermidibacterium keratini TaxID=1891644 RepID=A0A7L4YPJ9_9ACTN|nr:ABC transporter ATP-binding protein [Epidermidibacterium keratini]QHC00823.1 ATP-binding cassette domain-containing protein [Epidermidibacterium keratini]
MTDGGTARLPIATAAQVRAEVGAVMRGRRRVLALAIVVLVLSAAAGLIAPAALGGMVDAVGAADATGRVIGLGVLMVVGALAEGLLLGLGVVLASRLAERLLAAVRERMVARALRLPQGMVERAGAGDLISRATDDVAMISEVAPRAVPAIGGAAFTIVTTLGGMAVLDWRFALAMLLILPVHVLAVRWYLHNAPQIYRAERAANADKAARLLAALRGVETVRAFNLEERERTAIGAASWRVAQWSLRTRIVQNGFFGRLNLAEFIGLAAILVTAFWLVRADAVTVGMATTAALFFMRLFDPINELLFVIDDLQSALASLSRIVGVDVATDDRAVDAPQPSGGIALRGVDFGYVPGHLVVRDVSLDVDPGEYVALVGASGAGKSTVGALLAGLRDPQRGSRTLAADAFVITQDVHVFAGTIRDNLLLAEPEASDEQLCEAMAAVGSDGLLTSLADGLDTEVGHGGLELPAAAAQSLALARVVLADPSVVILDEPSAEAGSAQAAVLDAAVERAIAGRAALVIVHRLSQAAAASRIVVMSAGRIIEQGTHDELLTAGGEYAALWAAWSRGR